MPERLLQGVGVTAGGDKSSIVRGERRGVHPMYRKLIRRSKKYAAHDEENRFSPGDKVTIREARPFSKRKTWEVITDTA